jgi:hypothetical protein
MLRSLSFLRHHLYMVCNSKAGEWTRKQQSQWPGNMCDRFRYGVSVGKINDFVRLLFLCQVLFYSAFFLSTHCRCRRLLLHLTTITDTHTHTHSLSLSHSHTHTYTYSLSLSLYHSLTHTLSLTHTHCLSHSHTHTHTHGRTSLDEGLARCRDLYLKAHILNEQNIHAPGEIRSRNPSKRAAANPRLRQREHWDRPVLS